MKKMRLHIYIVLGVFIVGFILGSFLDRQLSDAIFSRNNTFGLVVSVVGTMPGYLMFAVIGGCAFTLGLLKKYQVIWRIVLYILAAAFVGLSIYFAGREFFGENGFTNKDLMFVGYLIVVPFAAACFYLGYYITKNSNRPFLWLILAITALAIFMALVPGTTLLKSVFHRPRYRTLVLFEEQIGYHNWWQRCVNYETLKDTLGISKEEFKSFPSGHASASAVFMLCICILPLFSDKYEKIQLPLFYGGLAWTLLVSFSRILVGAHFLSDVSMGGILTSVFMLIANEVIIAVRKKLEPKEAI